MQCSAYDYYFSWNRMLFELKFVSLKVTLISPILYCPLDVWCFLPFEGSTLDFEMTNWCFTDIKRLDIYLVLLPMWNAYSCIPFGCPSIFCVFYIFYIREPYVFNVWRRGKSDHGLLIWLRYLAMSIMCFLFCFACIAEWSMMLRIALLFCQGKHQMALHYIPAVC